MAGETDVLEGVGLQDAGFHQVFDAAVGAERLFGTAGEDEDAADAEGGDAVKGVAQFVFACDVAQGEVRHGLHVLAL